MLQARKDSIGRAAFCDAATITLFEDTRMLFGNEHCLVHSSLD